MSFLRDRIRFSLDEVRLFEMAIQRKELVDITKNHRFIVAKHVVKIFIYPTDTALHHWKSEVNVWLSLIQRHVYDRKKRLTAEQYFDILWRGPFENTDLIEVSMNEFVRREKYPAVHHTPNQITYIEREIEKVYAAVCKDISSGAFYDLSDYFS